MPTIEGLEGRLTLAGTLSLGTPVVLPATIQAETFGLNAAEVAYRNATTANQGGAFRATTPAAPTGLSAVATAATSVALSWTDNAAGESGSTIERKLGVGGSYSTLATLAANVTSYTDTTAVASTQYVCRVKATTAASDSSYSNKATATTPATPLVVSAGGPYFGVTRSPVALSGTASGGTGALQYAWDLDDNGTYETPGQNVSIMLIFTGVHMKYFQVTDALGRIAVAVAAATITVSQASADVVYSGPIVITSGGTYSGNWQSDNPDVAAVSIRTTAPVIIENSNLRGKGNLIETAVGDVDLTVRNSRGYGLNPGVAGRVPGRFLDGQSFDNIRIENNYMEGTSGIWLLSYKGQRATGDTVKILNNQVRNIDGRKSDGVGGWLDFNTRTRISDGYEEDGYEFAQFVQLDKVQNVPGIEIAWNEVINEPGESRVEDNINIYLSSGTASSPILIHDNYIHGAYTIKPWQGNTSDGTWNYDWSFSGGGILLGDGKPTSAGEAAAYVKAYNNQVISTTNYAIAIAAGHDNEFYSNLMISSDQLPGGRTIVGENSGTYIWNS